ncbi:hypothetical protein AAT19DRAFT_12879 [Rhodotorula toruloides]|uniref:Uncharacterized protein n=1 Tax=Rhodotorula toruloides TaxID=5286 RepID=A0A2T0ACY2_RHOTO|nr:hypothetical protein AAT19DRAFT_12879 [Rhodotorula toruloides]
MSAPRPRTPGSSSVCLVRAQLSLVDRGSSYGRPGEARTRGWAWRVGARTASSGEWSGTCTLDEDRLTQSVAAHGRGQRAGCWGWLSAGSGADVCRACGVNGRGARSQTGVEVAVVSPYAKTARRASVLLPCVRSSGASERGEFRATCCSLGKRAESWSRFAGGSRVVGRSLAALKCSKGAGPNGLQRLSMSMVDARTRARETRKCGCCSLSAECSHSNKRAERGSRRSCTQHTSHQTPNSQPSRDGTRRNCVRGRGCLLCCVRSTRCDKAPPSKDGHARRLATTTAEFHRKQLLLAGSHSTLTLLASRSHLDALYAHHPASTPTTTHMLDHPLLMASMIGSTPGEGAARDEGRDVLRRRKLLGGNSEHEEGRRRGPRLVAGSRGGRAVSLGRKCARMEEEEDEEHLAKVPPPPPPLLCAALPLCIRVGTAIQLITPVHLSLSCSASPSLGIRA